jgi:hypothetical protein
MYYGHRCPVSFGGRATAGSSETGDPIYIGSPLYVRGDFKNLKRVSVL